MAQTLDQILAGRKQLYDPQRGLIQQQQAALPGQEQADVAGLETAKTNAFGDITAGANAKGMTYSRAPIQEQQRYVGERYLPALANVKSGYADRRSKLDQALLGINADETTSAQQLQTAQIKAEQDAAYKAEQLQMQRERTAASLARGRAPKAPTTAERQAAFNQDLMSAFQYANSNYKPFVREQVAQQLAATYGVPVDQAQKQVNSVFTDSWDKAKRGVR